MPAVDDERQARRPGSADSRRVLTRVLAVVTERSREPVVVKALAGAARGPVVVAAGHEEAQPELASGLVDCVVVDLVSDRRRALDLVMALRYLAPQVPLVALTHSEDPVVAVQVLRRGGQDCVSTSGVCGPRLRRAVEHAVERQATQNEQLHRAFTDPVTGLPNRALFMDRVGHALARSGRHHGTVAVMFVDVNDFKIINDTHGHAVGDGVLAGFAAHLQTVLRPSDTVARYGGDEFTILCEEAGSSEDTLAVARRIAAVAETPLALGPHRIVLTASVGVAFNNRYTAGPDELVAQADMAMYHAKAQSTSVAIATAPRRAMPVEAAVRNGHKP